MADMTYIDKYIREGEKETISMKNLYDTILVGDSENEESVFRIPFDDFFLKYKHELEDCKQYYTIPDTMYYKPKMLSLQIYGTTELWLAVLRANNMRNTSEFHYPIIQLYNPDRLKQLIKVFFKREKKF